MFFAVMAKDGQLLPVHSKRDMEYMAAKGWKQREPQVAALLEPVKAQEPAPVAPKLKYTRKQQ